MNNIEDRLAALSDQPVAAPPQSTVNTVLSSGRRALRRRRVARGTTGAVAALAVAGAVAWGFTGGENPSTPTAAHRPDAAIQLVAYHGDQLPGYTVSSVPQGYVLQGISSSVLDVAKAGDTSSLDSFVGKITVMLDEQPRPAEGTPVTVNGHAGHLANQDGVQILSYGDGSHNVVVQAWSDVHITPDQLVQFAEGVTVLPNAQVGHG